MTRPKERDGLTKKEKLLLYVLPMRSKYSLLERAFGEGRLFCIGETTTPGTRGLEAVSYQTENGGPAKYYWYTPIVPVIFVSLCVWMIIRSVMSLLVWMGVVIMMRPGELEKKQREVRG